MGESKNKNMHRSTGRVLDILELIASNPNKYNLTEVCQVMECPKSSLHPILCTLVERNFLALDSNGHYKIDVSAYQVGNSYLSQLNIMDEVEKLLTNITNISLETSHFAILMGGDVFYLKKIDSSESIRMFSRVGTTLPAYATSLGKALLCDLEIADLRKLYPNGLTPLTDNTITDFDVLYTQLKQGRIDGFTYEVEESNQYIRCFAVPIRQRGTIVAAISSAIPVFRYSDEKANLIKALLFDAKSKLEGILNNLDTDFQNLIH